MPESILGKFAFCWAAAGIFLFMAYVAGRVRG
jgi:hypothetical protein